MKNVFRMTAATILFAASVTPSMGYEAGAVAGGGSISGVVKFKGTPPVAAPLDVNKDKEVCATSPKTNPELVVAADGGIRYSVVSITSIAKGKAFDTAVPTLDQKGCEYQPHVMLAKAGADVEVLNSDGILHNIHSISKVNPAVNIAQPKFKKKVTAKFEKPEAVKLTCDVHNWMQGWVIVQEHPYYAITDATGAFKLTDVPPGDYELKVWHGKLGEMTQKVTVQGGQDTKVTFELAGK